MNNTDLIRIRNFEKFQHYRDRNPPWIRLYTALLDDVDFINLPDDLKWPVVGLFLLAARLDNKIPANEKYLKGRLSIAKLDFQRLLGCSFVERIASTALADCQQVAPVPEIPLVPLCIPPNPLEQRETQRERGEGSAPAMPEMRKVYGEFGNVRLTDDEFAKLVLKLKVQSKDYIDRLDRWAVNEPAKFAKRKSHYATILTWHDRDVKDGKTYGQEHESREQAKVRRNLEASGIPVTGVYRDPGDRLGSGGHEGTSDSLPQTAVRSVGPAN